jgi:hypothetical protein
MFAIACKTFLMGERIRFGVGAAIIAPNRSRSRLNRILDVVSLPDVPRKPHQAGAFQTAMGLAATTRRRER